jgi:hypothetical protein
MLPFIDESLLRTRAKPDRNVAKHRRKMPSPSDRGRSRACNIYDPSGDTDAELARSVYATYSSADVPEPAQNLCSLLTWDCVTLIAFLSFVASGGCGPNRLSGRLEHFAAYAVSAAIAMVGEH